MTAVATNASRGVTGRFRSLPISLSCGSAPTTGSRPADCSTPQGPSASENALLLAMAWPALITIVFAALSVRGHQALSR